MLFIFLVHDDEEEGEIKKKKWSHLHWTKIREEKKRYFFFLLFERVNCTKVANKLFIYSNDF